MSKRSSDRNEKSEDTPPMSRLFVICGKNHTEEEFQEAFSPYGNVEEIYMVENLVFSKNVPYLNEFNGF